MKRFGGFIGCRDAKPADGGPFSFLDIRLSYGGSASHPGDPTAMSSPNG